MNNETILKKAIEKTVENGYSQWTPEFLEEVIKGSYPNEVVIFSHSFAKAFWGVENSYRLFCSKCDENYHYWNEKEVKEMGGENMKYCSKDGTKLKKKVDRVTEVWKGHLSLMVKEEEPLKYIEQFLNAKAR